jgi:hypothetical protein
VLHRFAFDTAPGLPGTYFHGGLADFLAKRAAQMQRMTAENRQRAPYCTGRTLQQWNVLSHDQWVSCSRRRRLSYAWHAARFESGDRDCICFWRCSSPA